MATCNRLANSKKNAYLCNLHEYEDIIMARPIKETPILYGEDARRFVKRMKNPPKESIQDRKRREANYKAAISMFVK